MNINTYDTKTLELMEKLTSTDYVVSYSNNTNQQPMETDNHTFVNEYIYNQNDILEYLRTRNED